MLWVKIKVGLEKELRKSSDPVCAKVVAAIDEERRKVTEAVLRERGGQEVTWRWMLIEFRKSLGNDLAVPPTPSAAWVQTQVSRCRRLGLDELQISDIAGVVRRRFRPPYGLEWLLRRAPEFLSEHDAVQGDSGKLGDWDGNVYTGRGGR